MKTPVRFRATLETPLIIARERQARVLSAIDRIPGSSLRGAILSAHRRLHGEDAAFEELVTSENRFPFLFPGPDGTRLFSHSAVSCKSQRQEHGITDILLSEFRAARRGANLTDLRDYEDASRCRCGEERRRHHGYHAGGATRPRLPVLSRMNVGIDRLRGTAASHILFGTEAVEACDEGKVWSGVGWIDKRVLPTLQKVATEPLFIGRKRSWGAGQISLELELFDPPPRVEAILEATGLLRRRLPFVEGTPFTLDLVTPLVSYDEYLRADTDPTRWLPPQLQARGLWFRYDAEILAGWDMAAAMPKDDEYVVAAGAVLLAESSLPDRDLAVHLAALELGALGERIAEGFGQVVANDPMRLAEPAAP